MAAASRSNWRPAGCGRRSLADTSNDTVSSERTGRRTVIEFATCTIPTSGNGNERCVISATDSGNASTCR